jgi:hypothetical protein
MRRSLLLSLALASCTVRPEPPPFDATPWLALELPEVVHSSVALAEFRGRVSGADLASADVVLVIDLTNTTLESSGVDADGDGTLGEDHGWAKEGTRSDVRWGRPARSWTTDFDDAIVSVELEASRRLLAALAGRNCRVGIVTFTGRPRVLVPVGPVEDAQAALERLRVPVDRTGTEARLALRRAGRLVDDAPPARGTPRRPILVFLSDGAETNRQQQKLRSDAEREAAALASRGIAVYALGFGSDEAEDPEFMRRLAAFGGGRYVHVFRAEDVLELVSPVVEIADVPVTNRALPDAGARALRVFPDGSFDGFLPLAPGPNPIELEVVLADGRRVRALHTLRYEPADEPAAADAALLDALRERTAETELANESQAGGKRRRTLLDIRGETREAPDAGAGPPGEAH